MRARNAGHKYPKYPKRTQDTGAHGRGVTLRNLSIRVLESFYGITGFSTSSRQTSLSGVLVDDKDQLRM